MTGAHEEVSRSAFLRTLKRGEIRTGTVSTIAPFGVFVNLGGCDGLVNIPELSWKHVSHPSDVVAVGDELRVEILDVDLDRERVSLSARSLQPDPWTGFAADHPPGRRVSGTVTLLVPFGAFVRIADGIDGLVHVTELADHPVAAPDDVVHVGDEVTVRILETDPVRRRVALSMKRAAAD